MTSTVSLEGIKQAVFFPFQGKKWGVKLVVGSALIFASFIIPIIPILPVFGYIGRIMRGIIVEQEDPQLPEWQDWGQLFVSGLKLFGAIFIYLLPGLILSIGGYALFMALDISLVISTGAAPSYGASSVPVSLILSVIGMLAGMLIMFLGFVFIFLIFIFIPPAVGNMIAKDDFSAAFRLGEFWPVFKANLSGYILAVAISLGVFYLLYMGVFVLYATIVLCFLLPFIFAFILFTCSMLNFSLFAVAYRDALKKMSLKAV